MSSVTGRISEVKQPWGGYIKPSCFKEIKFNDNRTLGEDNVCPQIVGMAVDYLTRFIVDGDVNNAFDISIRGYERRITILGKETYYSDVSEGTDIQTLISKIKGLDDISIIATCQACAYDAWFRNLFGAVKAAPASDNIPNHETICNIRTMVQRGMDFWEKFGPVTVSGFTFGDSGYTKTVSTGDGDYLTKDTIWDFKVLKTKIKSKHTLQLLMYWIMGQHSGKEEFLHINKLGVFNPRLNTAYILDVKDISQNVIQSVENEVICY